MSTQTELQQLTFNPSRSTFYRSICINLNHTTCPGTYWYKTFLKCLLIDIFEQHMGCHVHLKMVIAAVETGFPDRYTLHCNILKYTVQRLLEHCKKYKYNNSFYCVYIYNTPDCNVPVFSMFSLLYLDEYVVMLGHPSQYQCCLRWCVNSAKIFCH